MNTIQKNKNRHSEARRQLRNDLLSRYEISAREIQRCGVGDDGEFTERLQAESSSGNSDGWIERLATTIANTPDDRHAWSTLLAAESEREVDAAFDQIFDLVDQARQTGDISECERLVNWLVREEVIAELHVDILLSSLRLTATIRHEIQGWAAAVQAVADELSKRGTEVAEVDALLWGLRK